jgi:hypothetical protein
MLPSEPEINNESDPTPEEVEAFEEYKNKVVEYEEFLNHYSNSFKDVFGKVSLRKMMKNLEPYLALAGGNSPTGSSPDK